ncbi:helix-turn-helix domain-containing protein [Streptomyces sp. NPDC005402]|uniref:helix-turn-helix domain-containing protein n=1 Tax=Streptomyces sp. NPDC005402 TaxID=3155338 RepID=UPI0033B1F724
MDTPAPLDEWLSTAEVAAVLKVSQRTVQRWVRTDPNVKTLRLGINGSIVRVHRSAITRENTAPAS